MRVCLVSNYTGRSDEGMRKVAFHMEEGLSQRHQVLHLSLSRVLSPSFWKEARDFKPHIIHYVPGSSLWSFAITRALAWLTGGRTVLSAHFIPRSFLSRCLLLFFKPDLVLVQSEETEAHFSHLGCVIKFFPNGVDTQRFSPATEEEKACLRRRFGLEEKKFYFVHVGPIVKGRGLEALAEVLDMKNSDIIVVGSVTIPANPRLMKKLEQRGCIVWHSYIENIEEAYRLADGYVFPTPPGSRHAVELPLSVLEAMACNLPIVATKFGALPRLVEEGDGFFWLNGRASLQRQVAAVKEGTGVKTREKVSSYSWGNVISQLEQFYIDTIQKSQRKRSTLICLSGMDGAGKTTQAQALTHALLERGIPARYVWNRFQPWLVAIPWAIVRAALLRRKRGYIGYSQAKRGLLTRPFLARLFLYSLLLDCWLQTQIKVRLPLLRKKIVVCDRYFFDSLVDVAVDMGYSWPQTRALLRSFLKFLPRPGVTFVLDLPEAEAFSRKQDTPSVEYLMERRQLFLKLGEEIGATVLDGRNRPAELRSAILARVEDFVKI
ncbi:MAG: glycosyltransferase [Chloroflexi bacterium]|nr:glycosyltransferase [Chloroflexota bacterium]